MALVRKIVFWDFALFGTTDSVFCILCHCSKVRRKRVEVARQSGRA
jgi:hypothetical protein